MTAQR